MSRLSWRHQTLIQALLSRGPLSEQDFHSVFFGVTGKIPSTNEHAFNDYLLKINKQLSLVQLELRACRNQYDGVVYYGVVNNVADEQSKLGTKYTPPQIAFYKGITEAIAQDVTAKGVISNIDALNIKLGDQVANGSQSQDSPGNIPPAFKNFSMSQKEKALEELVRDQWLRFTSDDDVGLGIRSFLDLRGWFRNNDIRACDVCNEAGVKCFVNCVVCTTFKEDIQILAVLCQKEGCSVRMHQYCLNKKFSQKKVEKVCPGCGAPWLHSVARAEPVEEVKEEEEENVEPSGPSQNQPPRPPKRGRKRSFQPPISSAETRRTTRRSSQMR